MTREEIDNLNPLQPYCFETDGEELWYECGLVEGADIADKAMIEKACKWLEEHLIEYWSQKMTFTRRGFLSDFKQAMEE